MDCISNAAERAKRKSAQRELKQKKDILSRAESDITALEQQIRNEESHKAETEVSFIRNQALKNFNNDVTAARHYALHEAEIKSVGKEPYEAVVIQAQAMREAYEEMKNGENETTKKIARKVNAIRAKHVSIAEKKIRIETDKIRREATQKAERISSQLSGESR